MGCDKWLLQEKQGTFLGYRSFAAFSLVPKILRIRRNSCRTSGPGHLWERS